MELCSSNIKNFFIFQETETLKKIIIFQETEFSYISRDGNPLKTFYISESNFASSKKLKKSTPKKVSYISANGTF